MKKFLWVPVILLAFFVLSCGGAGSGSVYNMTEYTTNSTGMQKIIDYIGSNGDLSTKSGMNSFEQWVVNNTSPQVNTTNSLSRKAVSDYLSANPVYTQSTINTLFVLIDSVGKYYAPIMTDGNEQYIIFIEKQ